MIVEAITLISTANAAIGAVKELIGSGRDLMDCGKDLVSTSMPSQKYRSKLTQAAAAVT
jgi:hypothetical protein